MHITIADDVVSFYQEDTIMMYYNKKDKQLLY